MRGLWLRWSWRDLRSRWVQVTAIAFIIALGSGTYSGLSSTSAWRHVSNDESFASLHMHDLRIALSTGSYLPPADLVGTVRSGRSASSIESVEARLLGPTQMDASTPKQTILVPGRIVGVDTSDGGPHVDGIKAVHGRGLRDSDARGSQAGGDAAVLDLHFAEHYGISPGARVEVSGKQPLRVVGTGLSPEYFMITGEQGYLLAEANFAVTFVPLATAQRLLGRPGEVNDAVLTVKPGTDVAALRRSLERTLADRFPDVGFTITERRDERVYRYLYDDIKGDQRFYDIFAVLILAGAAFAAFNLTGRIVEAQRREIGIGMALGTPTSRLAIRPLLVAAQVALLGVALGVVVGVVLDAILADLYKTLLPLPIWRYPFQIGTFLRGAALGLVLPFAAALYPVWRAVRVPPVDAIRTGYLAERGGGLAPLLGRISLPGRTTAQMPFRNVLRAPRRTVMTLLGVAVAIAVLVGVVGVVDSAMATIDRADAELRSSSPDRLTVELDGFALTSDPRVTAIERSPVVGRAEAHLGVTGRISHGGKRLDTVISLVPFDSTLWRPTIERRTESDGPGIVLPQKAAHDLGVEPGDTVTLRHPRREGVTAYRFVDTPVRVVGISPIPARFVSFMDLRDARIMNLSGITNTLVVDPARGHTIADVQRGLFTLPGVASVQPVRAFTDTIRNALDRFLGILVVVEAAVLLLALLIAFNSASINVDERAREHATMLAFGLPLRSVIRMGIVESVVIGVLGTGVGLGAGYLLLDWIIQRLVPRTLPDLGLVTALSFGTIVTALVLGVVAVALAPLFTLRKLARMDLPSTLRVME